MAYKDLRSSKPVRIAIIVVAVILALGMTIPSVSTLLTAGSTASAASAESDASTTSEEDTTSDETTTTSSESVLPGSNTSLEDTNSYYQGLIDKVNDSITSDSTNSTYYRVLGNDYFSWASALETYHSDDETAAADALTYWKAAGDAYATYAEMSSDTSMIYYCAYSYYYAGDTEDAITQFEAIVELDDEYTTGWEYLAELYETAGDSDKAAEAQAKADELNAAEEAAEEEAAEEETTSAESSDGDTATSDATTSAETTTE